MAIEYTGKLSGSVRKHTAATLAATWENAYVVIPQDGNAPQIGLVKDLKAVEGKYPLVVFSHGSSGVNAQIKLFAYWLADSLRVATVVPDSMQTADRLTYSSPVPAKDYEAIHSMRLEELKYAMAHLNELNWFDGRAFVAGTSEGGVSAARYKAEGSEVKEKGKMIFSWSCEDNYHVESHKTQICDCLPVLNVMSAVDKFFSQANSYLDNPNALGHAGKVLANNPNAQIVLIPSAPHTLINLKQTRDAVSAFITRVLRS